MAFRGIHDEIDLLVLQQIDHALFVVGDVIDPLPGWLDRRRQNLPAAQDVVAKLPRGCAR